MYLVSPDYLNTVTSKNTPRPPPQSPNTEKAGKKHNSSKRLRSVKKIKTKKKKKYLSQREHDMWITARRGHDYDKWFKVRGKLHEADIERKKEIKTVADFLKQVLPASPSSDTQKEHGPSVKPDPPLPPRAMPTKRRRLAYEMTPALFHLRLGMSFMRRLLHSPSQLKDTLMMMMMMKTM